MDLLKGFTTLDEVGEDSQVRKQNFKPTTAAEEIDYLNIILANIEKQNETDKPSVGLIQNEKDDSVDLMQNGRTDVEGSNTETSELPHVDDILTQAGRRRRDQHTLHSCNNNIGETIINGHVVHSGLSTEPTTRVIINPSSSTLESDCNCSQVSLSADLDEDLKINNIGAISLAVLKDDDDEAGSSELSPSTAVDASFVIPVSSGVDGSPGVLESGYDPARDTSCGCLSGEETTAVGNEITASNGEPVSSNIVLSGIHDLLADNEEERDQSAACEESFDQSTACEESIEHSSAYEESVNQSFECEESIGQSEDCGASITQLVTNEESCRHSESQIEERNPFDLSIVKSEPLDADPGEDFDCSEFVNDPGENFRIKEEPRFEEEEEEEAQDYPPMLDPGFQSDGLYGIKLEEPEPAELFVPEQRFLIKERFYSKEQVTAAYLISQSSLSASIDMAMFSDLGKTSPVLRIHLLEDMIKSPERLVLEDAEVIKLFVRNFGSNLGEWKVKHTFPKITARKHTDKKKKSKKEPKERKRKDKAIAKQEKENMSEDSDFCGFSTSEITEKGKISKYSKKTSHNKVLTSVRDNTVKKKAHHKKKFKAASQIDSSDTDKKKRKKKSKTFSKEIIENNSSDSEPEPKKKKQECSDTYSSDEEIDFKKSVKSEGKSESQAKKEEKIGLKESKKSVKSNNKETKLEDSRHSISDSSDEDVPKSSGRDSTVNTDVSINKETKLRESRMSMSDSSDDEVGSRVSCAKSIVSGEDSKFDLLLLGKGDSACTEVEAEEDDRASVTSRQSKDSAVSQLLAKPADTLAEDEEYPSVNREKNLEGTGVKEKEKAHVDECASTNREKNYKGTGVKEKEEADVGKQETKEKLEGAKLKGEGEIKGKVEVSQGFSDDDDDELESGVNVADVISKLEEENCDEKTDVTSCAETLKDDTRESVEVSDKGEESVCAKTEESADVEKRTLENADVSENSTNLENLEKTELPQPPDNSDSCPSVDKNKVEDNVDENLKVPSVDKNKVEDIVDENVFKVQSACANTHDTKTLGKPCESKIKDDEIIIPPNSFKPCLVRLDDLMLDRNFRKTVKKDLKRLGLRPKNRSQNPSPLKLLETDLSDDQEEKKHNKRAEWEKGNRFKEGREKDDRKTIEKVKEHREAEFKRKKVESGKDKRSLKDVGEERARRHLEKLERRAEREKMRLQKEEERKAQRLQFPTIGTSFKIPKKHVSIASCLQSLRHKVIAGVGSVVTKREDLKKTENKSSMYSSSKTFLNRRDDRNKDQEKPLKEGQEEDKDQKTDKNKNIDSKSGKNPAEVKTRWNKEEEKAEKQRPWKIDPATGLKRPPSPPTSPSMGSWVAAWDDAKEKPLADTKGKGKLAGMGAWKDAWTADGEASVMEEGAAVDDDEDFVDHDGGVSPADSYPSPQEEEQEQEVEERVEVKKEAEKPSLLDWVHGFFEEPQSKPIEEKPSLMSFVNELYGGSSDTNEKKKQSELYGGSSDTNEKKKQSEQRDAELDQSHQSSGSVDLDRDRPSMFEQLEALTSSSLSPSAEEPAGLSRERDIFLKIAAMEEEEEFLKKVTKVATSKNSANKAQKPPDCSLSQKCASPLPPDIKAVPQNMSPLPSLGNELPQGTHPSSEKAPMHMSVIKREIAPGLYRVKREKLQEKSDGSVEEASVVASGESRAAVVGATLVASSSVHQAEPKASVPSQIVTKKASMPNQTVSEASTASQSIPKAPTLHKKVDSVRETNSHVAEEDELLKYRMDYSKLDRRQKIKLYEKRKRSYYEVKKKFMKEKNELMTHQQKRARFEECERRKKEYYDLKVHLYEEKKREHAKRKAGSREEQEKRKKRHAEEARRNDRITLSLGKKASEEDIENEYDPESAPMLELPPDPEDGEVPYSPTGTPIIDDEVYTINTRTSLLEDQASLKESLGKLEKIQKGNMETITSDESEKLQSVVLALLQNIKLLTAPGESGKIQNPGSAAEIQHLALSASALKMASKEPSNLVSSDKKSSDPLKTSSVARGAVAAVSSQSLAATSCTTTTTDSISSSVSTSMSLTSSTKAKKISVEADKVALISTSKSLGADGFVQPAPVPPPGSLITPMPVPTPVPPPLISFVPAPVPPPVPPPQGLTPKPVPPPSVSVSYVPTPPSSAFPAPVPPPLPTDPPPPPLPPQENPPPPPPPPPPQENPPLPPTPLNELPPPLPPPVPPPNEGAPPCPPPEGSYVPLPSTGGPPTSVPLRSPFSFPPPTHMGVSQSCHTKSNLSSSFMATLKSFAPPPIPALKPPPPPPSLPKGMSEFIAEVPMDLDSSDEYDSDRIDEFEGNRNIIELHKSLEFALNKNEGKEEPTHKEEKDDASFLAGFGVTLEDSVVEEEAPSLCDVVNDFFCDRRSVLENSLSRLMGTNENDNVDDHESRVHSERPPSLSMSVSSTPSHTSCVSKASSVSKEAKSEIDLEVVMVKEKAKKLFSDDELLAIVGATDEVVDLEVVFANVQNDPKGKRRILGDEASNYYQKTTLAQSIIDQCKDIPLVGLQYVLEVRPHPHVTLDDAYYICSLCSKKMNAHTLVAHIKSVPHRLKFSEIHCRDIFAKFGTITLKQWTASLVKEFTDSLLDVEAKLGRHKLAVASEREMSHVLASLKNKIEDMTELSLSQKKREKGNSSSRDSRGRKAGSSDVIVLDETKSSSSKSSVEGSKRGSRSGLHLRRGSRSRSRSGSPKRRRSRSPRRRSRDRVLKRRRSKSRSASPSRSPRSRRHKSRSRSPRHRSPYRRGDRRPRHSPPRRRDAADDQRRQAEKRRLEDFRGTERRLRLRHKEEEEELERNPESHPDYTEEWRKFWETRYHELEAQGLDPSRHDFKSEWAPFWHKRMKELHFDSWNRKRQALLYRLRLKDPGPPGDETPGSGPVNGASRDVVSRIDRSPSPWEEDNNSRSAKNPSPPPPQNNTAPPLRATEMSAPANDTNNLPKYEEEYSVIGTLKLLKELEDQLGSFGPAIATLLAKASSTEENGGNPLDLFKDLDNSVLVRYAKEKLASQISAGILGTHALLKTEMAIERSMWLQIQGEKLTGHDKYLGLDINNIAKATLGMDTVQIAQYIAHHLLQVGKSNASEEDLQNILVAVSASHTKMLANQLQLTTGASETESVLTETSQSKGANPEAPLAGSAPANSAVTSAAPQPPRTALFPSGVPSSSTQTSTSMSAAATPNSADKSNLPAGLSLLQAAYEDDGPKDMNKLSLDDLQALLGNFRSLNREEQQALTAYLKKLEATDSKKVTQLRERMQRSARSTPKPSPAPSNPASSNPSPAPIAEGKFDLNLPPPSAAASPFVPPTSVAVHTRPALPQPMQHENPNLNSRTFHPDAGLPPRPLPNDQFQRNEMPPQENFSGNYPKPSEPIDRQTRSETPNSRTSPILPEKLREPPGLGELLQDYRDISSSPTFRAAAEAEGAGPRDQQRNPNIPSGPGGFGSNPDFPPGNSFDKRDQDMARPYDREREMRGAFDDRERNMRVGPYDNRPFDSNREGEFGGPPDRFESDMRGPYYNQPPDMRGHFDREGDNMLGPSNNQDTDMPRPHGTMMERDGPGFRGPELPSRGFPDHGNRDMPDRGFDDRTRGMPPFREPGPGDYPPRDYMDPGMHDMRGPPGPGNPPPSLMEMDLNNPYRGGNQPPTMTHGPPPPRMEDGRFDRPPFYGSEEFTTSTFRGGPNGPPARGPPIPSRGYVDSRPPYQDRW